MFRKVTLAVLVFAVALVAAGSAQAATVPALPAIKRTLTSKAAVPRDCGRAAARSRRGVALGTYKAPMSGFVNVRLRAARGDWDLVLRDAASGRVLSTSEAFGSREVTQSWVQSGQRLSIVGCRRSGGARRAALSIQLLDLKPPKITGIPSLVRVKLDGRGDLRRLENTGLDVTENVRSSYADVVLANAAQRSLLASKGFDFTVRESDLQRSYARSRKADARFDHQVRGDAPGIPTGRTSYRVYADYQEEMKALVDDNHGLVRPVTMPHPSFQGRTVNGIEIADHVDEGGGNDGRPVFLLIAMHHAREWPSSESAMEFAHLLVNGAKKDKRIKTILERERIVIVPLINPDGFISSRSAADPADTLRDNGFEPNLDDPTPGDDPSDCLVDVDECQTYPSLGEGIAPPGGILAYRRKNCDGAVPDGRVPCELQYGVDPNRNYGELWGGPGASGDRTSQSYRGAGAWSEPETQNVHEYSAHRQITTLITLHNVAALVLRPPGIHDKGRAPDETRLRKLGDAMGDATGYTSEFGFQLYDTAGTTEDWNYAAAGTFGYTIEIGPAGGEFHMPYKTGVIDQWDGAYAHNGKGLREALLLAAENAYDPTDHSIIEGKAPKGRILRVRKSFNTFTSKYCEATIEPPVYFTGGPGQTVLPQQRCVNEKGPDAIADGLNTTLTVPKSGRFDWHVTPSTRPFAGQTSVLGDIDTAQSTRSDEFANSQATAAKAGDDPSWTVKGQLWGFQGLNTPPPDGTYIDKEFTLTTADDAAQLDVVVDGFNNPNDYDIYLFHKTRSGKLIPVDSSASAPDDTNPAQSEAISVGPGDLQFGTYVLRVVNYAADDPHWNAHVYRRPRKPDTVTTGAKEAWTLTCEDTSGNVLETRDLVVDRGGSVKVDLRCR
jgi:Zinc carboxypeptidase